MVTFLELDQEPAVTRDAVPRTQVHPSAPAYEPDADALRDHDAATYVMVRYNMVTGPDVFFTDAITDYLDVVLAPLSLPLPDLSTADAFVLEITAEPDPTHELPVATFNWQLVSDGSGEGAEGPVSMNGVSVPADGTTVRYEFDDAALATWGGKNPTDLTVSTLLAGLAAGTNSGLLLDTSDAGVETWNDFKATRILSVYMGVRFPADTTYPVPRRLHPRDDGLHSGAPRLSGSASHQGSPRILGGYL